MPPRDADVATRRHADDDAATRRCTLPLLPRRRLRARHATRRRR